MASHKFGSPAVRAAEARQDLERDIFLSAITLSVFRSHLSGGHGLLALKGGMALRSTVGSERMTGDVDLDASTEIPVRALEAYIKNAQQDLMASGLVTSVNVSHPKATETTQRWKFFITTPGGSQMHLKVEASRRPAMPAEPKTMRPVYENWQVAERAMGQPGAMIVTHTEDTIAANKLIALGNFRRMAPRDAYDLHLLYTLKVEPNPALMAEIPDETLNSLADEIAGKLESIDYEAFLEEVVPRLPPDRRGEMTREAWAQMQVEVFDYCDRHIRRERERRAGNRRAPDLY